MKYSNAERWLHLDKLFYSISYHRILSYDGNKVSQVRVNVVCCVLMFHWILHSLACPKPVVLLILILRE